MLRLTPTAAATSSGALLLGSLLLSTLLLWAPPQPARAGRIGSHGEHLSLAYDGRLLVKVLDLRLDQDFREGAYAGTARLRSSGVLALFSKIDDQASARGRITRGEPEPGLFQSQNIDGKSNRRFTVTWTGQDVITEAQPSLNGRLGDPPASRAQKLEATDPITGAARLALAEPDALCRGTLKVFDGKQRYDLDFLDRRPAAPDARERRLGLTSAVRCTVRYREVAGFTHKSRGDGGLKGAIQIGFAQLGPGRRWVISFLDSDTALGHARIELVRVEKRTD